jgi:hypothetical protein
MREIKFRVWCRDRNEWEKDQVFLTPDGLMVHLARLGGFFPLKPENHTISFFTGLHDRNGKEIWEGDILRSKGGRVFVIEWGGLGFISVKISTAGSVPAVGWELSEVIGSIYENPELLK